MSLGFKIVLEFEIMSLQFSTDSCPFNQVPSHYVKKVCALLIEDVYSNRNKLRIVNVLIFVLRCIDLFI